jgi:hypothetical protein
VAQGASSVANGSLTVSRRPSRRITVIITATSFFDEDISNDVESPPIDGEYDSHYSEQENNVYKGPMTRARMRHLQHEVNSLLIDYEHAFTKTYLLPKSGALLVLWFEEDAMQV